MNFYLYLALEAGLLILVAVAIFVAFREATSEDIDGKSDNERS
ncbi:MAG: hypothetical protein WCX65_12210 [bacterium]